LLLLLQSHYRLLVQNFWPKEKVVFARIGTFEMSPLSLDEVASFLRDHVVPAFSKHTGFRGYQAYVDRERGRLMGISLWTTRSALEASAETGREAVSKAAKLGAVVVGDMRIVELAFDVVAASQVDTFQRIVK
jgi:quinol monooxygenase YgiN